MARIRSIHPGLTSDESFMSMSMAAKAAWTALWTECDDHGVFEWKPIVLKARIFPADNIDFGALLDEYAGLDCVKKFEIDGKAYGIVRNFCRFQRPKNPSYRFPLPEWGGSYSGYSSSPTPALGEDTVSPTENPPQMKEEGGRREEKEEKKKTERPPEADAGFDEWYSLYPRKEDRGHALKAYRAALKKVDAATLRLAVQAAAARFKNTERQFIPLPATWLNGERWADKVPPDKAKLREMGEAW